MEEEIKECSVFFDRAGRNNVKFRLADLTDFVKKNSYDLAISVDVMEHIEEDVKVFSNIYKSLNDNGVLIISTPSDKGGSDVHSDHDESFIGEHVRDGYSIEDITAKLTRAGFARTECKYSYGPSGSLSWRLTMKYPLILAGFSKIFLIILPLYFLLLLPFILLLNYIDVSSSNKTGTGLIVIAIK